MCQGLTATTAWCTNCSSVEKRKKSGLRLPLLPDGVVHQQVDLLVAGLAAGLDLVLAHLADEESVLLKDTRGLCLRRLRTWVNL